ncbi:hypothetical protein B0H19DRAFT_1331342 [Mycena capillaripes]|nr:hypothetical protein B0H19DRAFT_1331342 [Mycena capillaripes]
MFSERNATLLACFKRAAAQQSQSYFRATSKWSDGLQVGFLLRQGQNPLPNSKFKFISQITKIGKKQDLAAGGWRGANWESNVNPKCELQAWGACGVRQEFGGAKGRMRAVEASRKGLERTADQNAPYKCMSAAVGPKIKMEVQTGWANDVVAAEESCTGQGRGPKGGRAGQIKTCGAKIKVEVWGGSVQTVVGSPRRCAAQRVRARGGSKRALRARKGSDGAKIAVQWHKSKGGWGGTLHRPGAPRQGRERVTK